MDEEKKYTYHIFIVLIFLAMPVLIFLIFILTVYEILAYFVRQIPKVICFLMKKGISFLMKKGISFLMKKGISFLMKKGISFIIEIVKMEKLRKVLTTIMILLITLAIIGMLYDAFMPSVMKYPHNLVQLYSSDVLENESNVLRRNINDTVENVNIDITQSNENAEKKDDYIKKEYLDSATYSYNVINTISGILTPLFSLLAVIVAFVTLRSQRKQNAIQNFESHLFQMIDQQHKLEEKVVNKHGSFRELYKDFCDIYADVWTYMTKSKIINIADINKMKEISLKISNYIFYFGVDQDFICDKTDERLIERYGLEEEKLKSLINELNNKLNEKYMYMAKEKCYKHIQEKTDKLFCNQKSEELGIYYRNLFNAIRYIDWECPDEDKKEYYAKLVRTNLSDFAQLMLYYNMQGERGSAWLKKDEVKSPKNDNDCLLTRYKPIKNCAISVKNKNIDPRNDGRTGFFSDDVVDYELKIGDYTH